MPSRSVGFMIVVAGGLVILVGLLVATGALSWFGRLPGDIRYQRGGTSVYVPIVSMIIVSVLLSLVLALARRIF